MTETTGNRSRRSKAAVDDKEAKPGRCGENNIEHVATAAYYLAEARGFIPGFELDDWLSAEADLSRQKRQ